LDSGVLFLQQLFNGLSVGSGYALFGYGFGLVYATMGILNIAYGQVAVVGATCAYFAWDKWALPVYLVVAVAMISGAIVGLLIDVVAFHPLRKRSRPIVFIISSIGVWFFLLGVVGKLTDHQDRAFDYDFLPFGKISILDGRFFLSAAQVWLFVASPLVGLLLLYFLNKSRRGLEIKAVGWNLNSASIGGTNTVFVLFLTAAIAGALAGLAGILTGLAFSTIGISLGEGLLIKGFAAVVVGGFGDIRGTYIGGLLIGVTETLSANYVSGEVRDAAVFLILFGFLLVRPRGIFAELKYGAAR
jgi:branched-chain amino acid transport system permease protein